MRPTLIVDADDTLWETEIYYERCIGDFGELMAEHGFDREEAERTVDELEHERVPLVGYGPHEFARTLGLAYQRLCQRHGRPASEDVTRAAEEIGQVVLRPPIELLEGVLETLSRLRRHFRLLLLTKGDAEIQADKLARAGLAHLFEGVHVVAEKDAQVLRELVSRYDLVPAQTWMIGNSPRSDINPALEAGLRAIHIPHSQNWSYEEEPIIEPERVTVLESFGELVDVLLEADSQEPERAD